MLGVRMGRYRSGAIALATMFVVGISPVAVSAQSLTDALISAYRNSQQLKSDRAALRATDEGVAAVIAGKRPSLSVLFDGYDLFCGHLGDDVCGQPDPVVTADTLGRRRHRTSN